MMKSDPKAQFANIIEKINEGFVALDAGMNYTYINQRGSELLQRRPEELIGKNYWEEYPQDRDTSFGKAYLQALETQTPVEVEDYYAPRGRWFANRIYPSENGLSIFFDDITERKEVEEKLRVNEDRLRLAVAAGGIGIWDIDLRSGVRTWSDEGKTIYGLAAHEKMDYERQLALIHPDDRARVDELVTAFRDQGSLKQLNLEHRILRPDGSLCWVEVHGEAIYEGELLPVRLIGTVIDITERKRDEEALRESEARFRILANAVPSMIWTAAPDGTITYANDQWFHFVGLTPDENAAHWPEIVLHPDDYERCVREWRHALETVPDEYHIEVRNRRYDGQYRWFQTRAVPLRDSDGQVIGWYGVTTDIHDRIEAERRLALLAEISELIRKLEEPNGLLYAISEAVGKHLRVRRCLFNEIDFENDREIVYRDYCDGLASVAGVHKISDYSAVTTAEVAAGNTVVNFDSKVDERTAQDYESTYGPNGERAYIAVPMLRDNRWVATLWVSDNVPRVWSQEEMALLETIAERTWAAIERSRAEAALRQSEERFRQAADAANALIYEVDVVAGETAVVYGMERVTGYDPQTTYTTSGWWHSLIHPEDLPSHLAQLEGNLQRGGTFLTEYRVQHKSGAWIMVQDNGLVIIENGTAIRIVGAITDITERKQIEEAILQLNEVLEMRVVERTAALVASEREVRRMASMLTMAEQEERRRISQLLHDELQQQLYAIQINLKFAQDDAETGNTLTAVERMAEAGQWLRESIEVTRQLTVDLSPPILKSEGLADALNWLIAQMKQTHGLKVLLTAEHAFRMPDEDMRVLLFQSIRELLFNTIKHAGTDQAAVELRSQNGQLIIHVRDEGCGFNVAEAAARAEQGGRLGLFSVRERLRLFGGRMEIDSAPGSGTRILIHIPTDLKAESL
jgi:PAS domain S-box-containing protein